MRHLFFSLVFLAASAAAVPARAQNAAGASGNLPPAERAYVASEIDSAVKSSFAHWQGVPGFDLRAAYKAYLAAAFAARDRREFDLASMEFLARLHNGHTGFGDKWLEEHYGQPLGFYAAPLEGQWVVRESRRSGLKPGDVIEEINDEPMGEFYEQRKKYLSGSNERWGRISLFEDHPVLFPERMTIRLAGGRTVAIDREREKLAAEPSRVETRWLEPGTIAYIRIPSFGAPEFQETAVEDVKGYAAAKALVIDVRRNHGGSTPEKLVKALMDRPYRWFAESTPLSIGVFEAYRELAKHPPKNLSEHDRGYMEALADYFTGMQLSWPATAEEPENPLFRGRLVILIDGGCFSACEDFVEPFKDNHRATLVGETTGGSSGQPYFRQFSNGMVFSIGAKRESFPDGAPFEGVGIAPDVPVELSAVGIAAGRDLALARAIRIASGE